MVKKMKQITLAALLLMIVFSLAACMLILRPTTTTSELKPEGNPISRSFVSAPTKTEYRFGDTIDPSGAVIKNHYENGTTDTFTVGLDTSGIYTRPAKIADFYWHNALEVELYCEYGKIGSYSITSVPPTEATEEMAQRAQYSPNALYKTDDIYFFYPKNLVRSELVDAVIFEDENAVFTVSIQEKAQSYYEEITRDDLFTTNFESELVAQGYHPGGFATMPFMPSQNPNEHATPNAEFAGYVVPISKNGAHFVAAIYVFSGIKTYVMTVIKDSSAYTDGEGTHYNAGTLFVNYEYVFFVRQG
jgi:hypothetical protein